MNPVLRIVVAAGGTGGHLFPALAVAEAIRELVPCEVIFVGTGRELEQRIVGGAGYPLEALSLGPVTGRGKLGLLKVAALFPLRMFQARRLLRRLSPDAVIGFGGYPSVLPVVAAASLGIPRILHEQNAEVGLANRVLSKIATRIFAAPGADGFPRSISSQVHHLGNPVRKAMSAIPPWQPPGPNEPIHLLILGGSQGAVSVNSAILQAAPALSERNLVVLHQTGERDHERMSRAYAEMTGEGKERFRAVAFIEDMYDAYSQAHLIISRAGAMSAAEIAESGRPAIFIPLPIARSHQRLNVRHLEAAEAALVVEQREGFERELERTIVALLDDRSRLASFARHMSEVTRAGGERSAVTIARAVVALGSEFRHRGKRGGCTSDSPGCPEQERFS